MKAIDNLLAKSNNSVYSFTEEFNNIIKNHLDNYGKNKKGLKSFFEDLQHGGCVSGMISEFVYHSDCKEFYIKHIDDLEEMKTEMEDSIGDTIKDRYNLPHYTFLCWLCFEEYCNDLYNTIFE